MAKKKSKCRGLFSNIVEFFRGFVPGVVGFVALWFSSIIILGLLFQILDLMGIFEKAYLTVSIIYLIIVLYLLFKILRKAWRKYRIFAIGVTFGLIFTSVYFFLVFTLPPWGR